MTDVLVVVGPGVVPDHVEAVRRFAATTGLGVLNTYGVKGLFRWDDPAHLGTIGLQERDVELAGVLDADLVLGIGLDERELGPADLGSRLEVVDPADLDAWADRLGRATEPPRPGRLYTELRAALLPLYESEAVPFTPAAAAADLAEVLPDGGLVCADPGPVGLWVARALPTSTPLGSVLVPPVAGRADAPAAALAAAQAGRPVVLCTHHPASGECRAALERAEANGWPLVVEVWGDDASPVASRAERRERLAAALAAGGQHLLGIPVDLALTRVLVDVAGPVSAWQHV
jgi:thiamine pyrophosphate-dependent acetolactate synthase large subunit-like protein